jgi:hypothetical protein
MPDLESTRPANVETPAEAPPIPKLPSPDDEPADDLFGPPSIVPQTNIPPREENSVMMPAEPADEPPADDLPGAPTEETPAEEPADQPADQPAEESEPALDELFGSGEGAKEPTEEQPAEEQPAEEQPSEEEEPSVDDLFGDFGMILDEPGGLSSDALRQWVDNTGRFTCQGRLLRIADGHVRLLKDNGRTTTVPFSRLSQGDRHFVERQASAQHFESVNQTAQH